MNTLKAATANGADAIGREEDLGTLERGKLAELLVVDGDPMDDIRVLQDPSRIVTIVKTRDEFGSSSVGD